MVRVYVYNSERGKVELFYREVNESMPYTKGYTLPVNEFRGNSDSSILWTDIRAMHAWNSLRAAWGEPIYIGFAFSRIWERVYGDQSQHNAGIAFDIGQNLNADERENLRRKVVTLGTWTYVEPSYLTPFWVHIDNRLMSWACLNGYPIQRYKSISVYVFVLQDALNAIGIIGSGLDGVFGNKTLDAVKQFQKINGLLEDGIVGSNTWTLLIKQAQNIGRTSTVINP